jgi:hypothetical protein
MDPGFGGRGELPSSGVDSRRLRASLVSRLQENRPMTAATPFRIGILHPLLCLLYSSTCLLLASPPAAGASVGDFGARGDGQADDTAAIERAVARSGGQLHFPRGVYRLTRPVKIELARLGPVSISGDGAATLLMAGPGPALHLLGTHAGSADPASVKEPVWQNERSPLIDGLVVVGAHEQAIGIQVEGCLQPVVTRVTVRRCLHGMVLTGRNRNVIVGHVNLYDNRGVGLLLEKLNLHQVNVSNSHISYNRGGGIVVRASEIRNLQIGTCDIEANMAADGAPSSNFLLDCTEGSVREGAIIGCTLQHSKAPVGAANIRFVGKSAKEPHKVGFFSIGDNQISDCGVNIHLTHARGVNITGNTFFLGHQHNLLVEDSSQIVVGPNVFDRNPDYPPGSRDGIALIDCRDCTLTGLHVLGARQPEGAVTLRRCQWINLTASMILDCDGCGLLLDAVEHCRVSDCVVRDQRQGRPQPVALRLTSGKENRLGDNLFAGRLEVAAGTVSAGK